MELLVLDVHARVLRVLDKRLQATRPAVGRLRVAIEDADGREGAVEGASIPDFDHVLGCSFPALSEVVDCWASEVYVTLSRTGELLDLETRPRCIE